MDGAYTNTTGNFTLPKVGGLTFPDISLDLGSGILIEAQIGLTAPATGNYNEATGAMNVNPKISLTLGTDEMANLPPDFPISGEGPLKCQIAPLDVNLSTNSVNWPANGSAFTDKPNIKQGALAGGWNTKPKVVSVVPENASLCPLIGGLLDPVRGLFLANSTPTIAEMPSFSGTKLTPRPCDAGTTGIPGTPQADCKVTNSGETAGSSTVALKSSNKKATVPKSVKISVPAGETASKTVTVKASKMAKGKVAITAKASGRTGKANVKV